MSDNVLSIALTSHIVDVAVGLLALLIAYAVLILIDRANGSNFKDRLAEIQAGNLSTAIYEAVKFFTVGYVVSNLLK